MEQFDDLLAANKLYVENFSHTELTGSAKKGLAIITCMDSRIDPLSIVGMGPGDAKILRNAGARVTDDVLRTLILATHLLNVNRILIMPHTDCRMASGDEATIHQQIMERSGVDTRSVEIRTVKDQVSALNSDILRVETSPFLNKPVKVMGAIYDVNSGKLNPINNN
jgi:carbonic anhydrase